MEKYAWIQRFKNWKMAKKKTRPMRMPTTIRAMMTFSMAAPLHGCNNGADQWPGFAEYMGSSDRVKIVAGVLGGTPGR
ncbi:MAG: hypothetical protein AMXMBFR58_25790 [Phycisphaerae bacterium]